MHGIIRRRQQDLARSPPRSCLSPRLWHRFPSSVFNCLLQRFRKEDPFARGERRYVDAAQSAKEGEHLYGFGPRECQREVDHGDVGNRLGDKLVAGEGGAALPYDVPRDDLDDAALSHRTRDPRSRRVCPGSCGKGAGSRERSRAGIPIPGIRTVPSANRSGARPAFNAGASRTSARVLHGQPPPTRRRIGAGGDTRSPSVRKKSLRGRTTRS